jgi:hypothetical protein
MCAIIDRTYQADLACVSENEWRLRETENDDDETREIRSPCEIHHLFANHAFLAFVRETIVLRDYEILIYKYFIRRRSKF